MPKIDGVEIEREDVLLAVHVLNFDGSNPLLGLHHQNAQPGHLAQQACGVLGTYLEEVLDQLLGDGAGTTGIALHDVLHRGKKSLIVNAMMLVEAFVLGSDEGINHIGGNLGELDRRAVLVEVLANQHAIGTIYEGGIVGDGILDDVRRGRHAKEPEEVRVHST